MSFRPIAIRYCLSVLAILILCPYCILRADDSEEERIQAVKSAFLLEFVNYIEWPDKNKNSKSSESFKISIIGNSSYLSRLQKLAEKKYGSTRVIIEQTSLKNDFADTDILFLDSCSDKDLAEILAKLKKTSVLLITDSPGFAELGSMINFFEVNTFRGRKIKFEINLKATQEAGLKISAQLLKLATLVETKAE